MNRRALLAGAGLSIALTACGTTVPVTSQGAGSGPTDQRGTTGVALGGAGSEGGPAGSAATGSATVDTGTSSPAVAVGSSTSSSGGSPRPSAGAVSGTGSSTSSGAGSSPPSAGVVGGTLAPVKIGFTTVPDAAAFFASFGGSNQDVDQAAMFRNAVAWVNAHGGLNGHPIDAKIEAVSATSQESYDSQYQKLCAKYTQDDKVVAASNIGVGANTNMDACMNKARTLFLTGSNTLHDEQNYAATPYVVSPQETTSTVLAKTLAQLIVSRGFEKSGGKVGFLQYDLPEYNRAFDRQLKPILAAAGIGVVRYTIPPPASTSQIGNSVAVVQSAQLKMASQGVKTVTMLCAGCAGFFIQAANSQNYYPRYVLSSMDSPGAATGATYDRAMRSSVSVGWEPLTDYGSKAPPVKVPHNATWDECTTIQKKLISSQDTLNIALLTCDAVLKFYYAAKANPTQTITAESLRDGLLRLGTSHPSAMTFASALSPAKHAGASQYRLMTWNAACSCPSYSGSPLAFPRP